MFIISEIYIYIYKFLMKLFCVIYKIFATIVISITPPNLFRLVN